MPKRGLQELLKKPTFTSREAKAFDVHTSRLAYYAKKGTIERISRGLYRSSKAASSAPFEWQELLEIVQSIPNAVICGVSALTYYELTLEFQRKHWIAIPHKARVPRRPKIKVIRMRNIELGRQRLKLGEYNVQIFDRERCVVEAFKYLSRESALRTLRAYLGGSKGRRPDFKKLLKYAKALRVDLGPYLEAMQIND
jgi:predicted transcriptional regulator of viral defense system